MLYDSLESPVVYGGVVVVRLLPSPPHYAPLLAGRSDDVTQDLPR